MPTCQARRVSEWLELIVPRQIVQIVCADSFQSCRCVVQLIVFVERRIYIQSTAGLQGKKRKARREERKSGSCTCIYAARALFTLRGCIALLGG